MDGHAIALSTMGTPAGVSVRLNPFKPADRPLPVLEGARRVPWSPYGYILAQRPVFTLDPLLHAGAYYVQDSSAMFVGDLVRRLLEPGTFRVLDLCAAPGGKTTDVAASLRERFGDRFLLVANEVMRARAAALADNLARWGDPNVVLTSVDPQAFGRLGGFFDMVIADVPCSGEGMFRKDPRAVEEWSPELVALCAARQRRILADAWPCLREGGVLVYSTCTFEEAENDDNLQWAAETLGGEIIPPAAAPEGVRRDALFTRSADHFRSCSKVFLASSQPAARLRKPAVTTSFSSPAASAAAEESCSAASFRAALAASTFCSTWAFSARRVVSCAFSSAMAAWAAARRAMGTRKGLQDT